MLTREKKIDALRRKYNFSELGLYFALYKRYTGLEIEKNIRYATDGKRTYLDIVHEKNGGNEKHPPFIYLHGGGWVSGRRTARIYYCDSWAKQGYVCANIGYDYANDAKHPEHLREIFKGIEYVLDRAEHYNIDSTKVVIAGESAGAYFAAFIGAIATHRELYQRFAIPFKYQERFNVSACVLMSGIYDPARSLDTKFKDMDGFAEALCGLTAEELQGEGGRSKRDFLAPSFYADAKFPPSFIIGSKQDLLLSESVAMHNELTAAGVMNQYALCGGLNGVHACALLCQVGDCKKALQKAQAFALEACADREKEKI